MGIMWTEKLLSVHSARQAAYGSSETDEYVVDEDQNVDDVERQMLRTQLLVLDYKQFKAARLIQRTFRGWHVRVLMARRRRAAIVIQRAWRKYSGVHFMIVNMQAITQSVVELSYNDSCIKIQSLFRGWYSRKYINNMMYLKNIQLNALEDILHSIIYKLHTLKRTEKLPGILTFRTGESLSKIEEFMATMAYRLYNRYVGRKWAMHRSIIESQRMDFLKAVEYTWAPYYGNDHINVCNPPPPPKVLKNYERREYDVSQTFMASRREVQSHKCKKASPSKRARVTIAANNQMRFCRDLVHSMQRWNLDDNSKLIIPDDVLCGNFKDFLKELQGYLTTMNYIENCDCLRDSSKMHGLTPYLYDP
ncbi:hypothetical protein KR093_007973 [Drosophila rubida]|uniref:Uncharacterized protein n=1 Tax=Drosophila rubida TaxID=30044 RepID=A0AAD4K6K9_9MUSC|nr:hypothetical protein KR093_007973 [Drosophila rubida]